MVQGWRELRADSSDEIRQVHSKKRIKHVINKEFCKLYEKKGGERIAHPVKV